MVGMPVGGNDDADDDELPPLGGGGRDAAADSRCGGRKVELLAGAGTVGEADAV